MDYAGQRLGENIYYFLTIFFGAVAWIVGYVKEDFYVTVLGWSIGLGLSLIICIPDWPLFNRKPVVWLEKVGQKNQAQATSKNQPVATASSTTPATSSDVKTETKNKTSKNKKDKSS